LEKPASAPRPRFESLADWLAWFETLHPKKIDFSLDRIRLVLAALEIDSPSFRVITVGGTNGKGSCVALLENVYLAAGYRVGAFTSPHLWRFNERIRINGDDVQDDELIELFQAIDAALGNVTLSYFESSAVAAILSFARHGVDLAVLEVGMGGRLDAVNALEPDAALIVSIDIDHTDWLGPDREAIGYEKAGIMRANRPLVLADIDPPKSVLRALESTGARPFIVGRDYDISLIGGQVEYRSAALNSLTVPLPRFGGALQARNVGACLAVVESLMAVLPVGEPEIVRGIAATTLPGRIDIRTIDGVEWVFDVAHNAAAVANLLVAIDELPDRRPTFAVFGAMRDKELESVLRPFVGRVDAWHVGGVDSERGASEADIADLLRGLGGREVTAHPDIAAAAHAVLRSEASRVLVFGSFYTVGPVMAELGLYSDPRSAG